MLVGGRESCSSNSAVVSDILDEDVPVRLGCDVGGGSGGSGLLAYSVTCEGIEGSQLLPIARNAAGGGRCGRPIMPLSMSLLMS